MARPRSIPWEKRIRVFLAYRERQRVYPVAKDFDVSRSAVRTIKDEFEAAGFSTAPRAALSPELLLQLQQRHLDDVVTRLGRAQDAFGVDSPDDPVVGRTPAIERTQLADDLVWHIRGTEVEQQLTEIAQAVSDYYSQCRDLWDLIRLDLEHGSLVPVLEQNSTSEPCLYPEAVAFLYREAFRLSQSGASPSTHSWVWLSGSEDESRLVLRTLAETNRLQVAFGDSVVRKKVQESIETYVNEGFMKIRGRARHLLALYGDLSYLETIAKDVLRKVKEEEVRGRICPACPYPEVVGAADTPAE